MELPSERDPAYVPAVKLAVAECHRCPVLMRCGLYLDAMHPALRPDGCVMAGKVLPVVKPEQRGRPA
jgi:hypothetical protein